MMTITDYVVSSVVSEHTIPYLKTLIQGHLESYIQVLQFLPNTMIRLISLKDC